MLKEAMDVTMSLQTDGHSLADCRDDLDMLIEAVRDEKLTPSSPFYNSKLDTKHIAPDSSIVAYPKFENAVIKQQLGLAKDLTDSEEESVAKLRKSSTPDILDGNSSTSCSIAEGTAKKRRVCQREAEHVDTSFTLGSVARVERQWSIAKYVSTSVIRRMTSQLLEALLF